MKVKIIPKQENIPDFDTKEIQIKHIDYYDPPYSSYEADEITEEVISKILEEIPQGLNIYLYLDPYGEVEMFEVNCDGEWLAISFSSHGGTEAKGADGEQTMGIERLKSKIEEQQAVYQALKAGNVDTVCYKEFHNGEWGTDDENYTNRLRLSYYLLYCHIEDEETVAFLFEEELKDRERNSFQGIGSTLQILTHLIRKYNGDGKYAGLLKQAKNANFDCACGYDPEGQMEDDFGANSLLDCIYLCREMEYRDVMGSLVDEWKENTAEWSDSNCRTLIDFNTFLGRDAENERLYQEQLKKLLSAGNSSEGDIISGYKNLIRHYIHSGDYGKAFHLCEKVIETTDYEQIRTLRLFKDILEACFEVAANYGEAAAGLWNWAKTELQKVPQSSWYGNLYIKGIAAAKTMDDSYGKQLEQKYESFLASSRR